LCNAALIQPTKSSIHLEISTCGSHLKNRHKQSLHRMGNSPISSSGQSDQQSREVLMRDRPQSGQFMKG